VTLSPEALAARAALDAETEARRRDIFDGRRPMVAGARTIGALALIGPGVTVRTDPTRRRREDRPLQGIVVQVLDAYTDADTGEMIGRRFRCYDPLERDLADAFRVIAEDWVSGDGVEATELWSIETGIARLCRAVADHHGPMLARQLDWVHDAHRLATAHEHIGGLA
jgi:hypothetical protein